MNNNWTSKDDLHLEKTLQHVDRSRNEIINNIGQSRNEIINNIGQSRNEIIDSIQKELISINSKLDRILIIVWSIFFVAVFYGIMYLIIS